MNEKQKERRRKKISLIAATKPNSEVGEQFRTIRTNIQFSIAHKNIQTILFSSSKPAEGKTTVCINVATTFANQGARVLIVDADMRLPSVTKTFSLNNHVGLSTLLLSDQPTISHAIQHIPELNLDVLPSGLIPPNPSELLNTERMDEIIEILKQQYDLIFFDLPPIVSVTDAQIMATKVDGVIVVVRKGIARTDELYKAKELFEMVDGNIIGAVFNGTSVGHEYSKSYYY